MSLPRFMTISDSERLTKLETQVGDSDSGILGELKSIKDKIGAMELRLYGVLASVGTITYFLFGK